ncbi:hypothetical protein [Pontiella desulfatans]|uniref:hypothetical protein n=1 Tax=Pontiella desulfatans TaxID=2750659 RepID=UPI00109CB4C3|nr:hypothetical protein [Pontiella desulfatans]
MAIEAIKGVKTLAELARNIRSIRTRFRIEEAVAFECADLLHREKEAGSNGRRAYGSTLREIGRLKMDVSGSKKSYEPAVSTRRSWVEPAPIIRSAAV